MSNSKETSPRPTLQDGTDVAWVTGPSRAWSLRVQGALAQREPTFGWRAIDPPPLLSVGRKNTACVPNSPPPMIRNGFVSGVV
jgi:hypothetical protein